MKEDREFEIKVMDIGSSMTGDLNNFAIDLGKIVKELEGNFNCPKHILYMLEGIRQSAYDLRDSTGEKREQLFNLLKFPKLSNE